MENATKKLVVGQEVLLFGVGYIDGKVVSVTPSGVDVQGKGCSALFSFNNDGEETEESRCRRVGPAPSPDDRFHNMLWHGAPEWQPWKLVPPERAAALDQIGRVIGYIWGSGPITQAMWQDRNLRDAVEILENLARDIRDS